MDESESHILNEHRDVEITAQGRNKQLAGLTKFDVCGFVSMNANEFDAHIKHSHINQPRKDSTQAQILVNDKKAEEEHHNCEKCEEEKQLLKKQVKDLQLLMEVGTEVFNEQLEVKKKELEKIKKEGTLKQKFNVSQEGYRSYYQS